MYGVYDMKNYEQCMGIFKTKKEIGEYFNTTMNAINSQMSRNQLIKFRYMVVKIEEEE